MSVRYYDIDNHMTEVIEKDRRASKMTMKDMAAVLGMSLAHYRRKVVGRSGWTLRDAVFACRLGIPGDVLLSQIGTSGGQNAQA